MFALCQVGLKCSQAHSCPQSFGVYGPHSFPCPIPSTHHSTWQQGFSCCVNWAPSLSIWKSGLVLKCLGEKLHGCSSCYWWGTGAQGGEEGGRLSLFLQWGNIFRSAWLSTGCRGWCPRELNRSPMFIAGDDSKNIQLKFWELAPFPPSSNKYF